MHFIFISLFLLTTFIYAKQSDFSVIIHKPFDAALFDITEDYERQISAVGFSQDYKTSTHNSDETYTSGFDYLASLSSPQGIQAHLVKVDSTANIRLSKAQNLPQFNKAVALVRTPSNGYFVGGSTLDGSFVVYKLNSQGETLFTKIFGTQNSDTMHSLIALKDGGVLAVGSSTTTRSNKDDLFETGLGLNDIYLARFSQDGTKLWSKKFGTGDDERGIDAVEADDGSIIVLGTTSHNAHQNVTLMRITEEGNKIWLKNYNTEKSFTPHKIIKLRDKHFLISLSFKDKTNKEQIQLVKFDLQQNIILDKKISTPDSSVLKDIKEYSDGKIIAVGYTKKGSNTDGLVMILDENLHLRIQKQYGGLNYDMFNALTILHNSQAAAAGIHTDEHSEESNMWIVKLNPDATLSQISSSANMPALNNVNFYDTLIKLFKEEIAANQLLISKDLSIELLDQSLYFEIAKYELTVAQKIFLDNFSKKLLPFLEKHQSSIHALEVNGHTSSEWEATNFTQRYLKNEKLSMNRAYSVISHIFTSQNKSTQQWLTKVLRGSGFSYSKKIVTDTKEDKRKSRRVSLQIIVK
jgi:outer membrane protein OmpA-like peptidoglycan-associated protein